MSDLSKPKRRWYQFSLRKLLLWTAVVALYLGILRTLSFELTTGELVFCTCWLVVAAILRVAFGPQWAGVASVVVGMTLIPILAWRSHFASGRILRASAFGLPEVNPVDVVLGGLISGALFGLVMFGLVEGTFRAVNSVDKLMETRADHE